MRKENFSFWIFICLLELLSHFSFGLCRLDEFSQPTEIQSSFLINPKNKLRKFSFAKRFKEMFTATCLMFQPCFCNVWSHILLIFGFVFNLLQEGAISLRHDLSSNDLNNNDNEFDDNATELGDQTVNLSNDFSESMNGTYQHQATKKQVSQMTSIYLLLSS